MAESNIESFQLKVNELLPENTSQSSFNDEWNSIKETLSKASEIAIGYKPKAAKKLWFDDDCKKFIEN